MIFQVLDIQIGEFLVRRRSNRIVPSNELSHVYLHTQTNKKAFKTSISESLDIISHIFVQDKSKEIYKQWKRIL